MPLAPDIEGDPPVDGFADSDDTGPDEKWGMGFLKFPDEELL